METRKVLVRYGAEVIPEEEGRFESVYIAEKGHELLVIETALHTLKRSLRRKERGEVLLAPDLAVSCFTALMLKRKGDKSFIPEGITLVVALFSGPSMPES
jgi:hypothetical protein